MNFKCNANYVYKIPNHIAPTIKEKADIWKKCAPLKARSILLAFFIVATIIIVIYTYKYKNVIHSLIGVGVALLLGILIYNVSISNTEYDSEEMLNLYATHFYATRIYHPRKWHKKRRGWGRGGGWH